MEDGFTNSMRHHCGLDSYTAIAFGSTLVRIFILLFQVKSCNNINLWVSSNTLKLILEFIYYVFNLYPAFLYLYKELRAVIFF